MLFEFEFDMLMELISLVETIIEGKRSGDDVSTEEIEIDLLVYHLYGLTYDEVLIVDPGTPITQEEYNNNK